MQTNWLMDEWIDDVSKIPLVKKPAASIMQAIMSAWLRTIIGLPEQSAVWLAPGQLSPSASLCSSPPKASLSFLLPVFFESLAGPSQLCAFWFRSWFLSEEHVWHRGGRELNRRFKDTQKPNFLVSLSILLSFIQLFFTTNCAVKYSTLFLKKINVN